LLFDDHQFRRSRLGGRPGFEDRDVPSSDSGSLLASRDKQFKPAPVIPNDIRGLIEWKAADGQPINLTISWVR
jgi:hypothetical protein